MREQFDQSESDPSDLDINVKIQLFGKQYEFVKDESYASALVSGVGYGKCYDDETEILTEERGWQLFKDLVSSDRVAVLTDYNEGTFQFEYPRQKIDQSYEGDILEIKNNNIDLAVTPDHDLLLYPTKNAMRPYRAAPGRWFKQPAGEVYERGNLRMRVKCLFDAHDDGYDPILFEFLGLFFHSGSVVADRRTPYVKILTKPNNPYAEDLLTELGIEHRTTVQNPLWFAIRIFSPSIVELVSEFTDDYGLKRVPAWIKNAHPKYIKSFLRGYWQGRLYRYGEGVDKLNSDGGESASTESKLLADDLQEMGLRCGLVVHIVTITNRETGGFLYNISVLHNADIPIIYPDNWSKRKYKGKVYCVDMGGRPVLVRRNNLPVWSYNSLALAYKTFLKCIEEPGAQGFVTSPTYSMLRDSTLLTWWNVCPRDIVDWSKSELVATFKHLGYRGGSRVSFRNTSDPDLLRGPNLSFWAMDEAAISPYRSWQIGVARVRLNGFHRQLYVVTSPRGFNWIYDVFVERANENRKIFVAASYENPFLPIETLQEMAESYSKELFQQEVEGLFVNFEGAVFPSYNPEVHVGEYPYIKDRPVWLMVDFGYANPYGVAAAQIDANGRIFIIDEEYRTRCTDEEMTAQMRAKPYWKDVRGAVGDSAEPDRILRLQKMGWPILPADKMNIPTMIESIRQLLEVDPVLQSPMLLIDKKCENTQLEFKLYTYPENTRERNAQEIPIDRYNHLISAIGYYISTFWSRLAGVDRPTGPQARKVMAFQSIGKQRQPHNAVIARDKLSRIRN